MSDSLDQFVNDALREFDEQVSAVGESPGHVIGAYTLSEEIGVGGFGSVWRAQQAQPVRREVALKIIKAGMDTREVIARFSAERQALAVLDHPNIAKVFEAGATPSGRPYFVMELVRGVSLTRFCDEAALPVEARLRLFIQICHAVQHAHQKGIIHRDLKPSNLLVSLIDGEPVPKVIDFGIAKASDGARLADETLVTRMDRLMGTPAYMSPEQSLPGMDLDTRTDIYSLGVVLYELLTGQVPFPLGIDGRVKRERDTQRPSTRIKSLPSPQAQRLGETRRVTTPRLIGLVKGDLDWIAVKALEEDRARRYDSAMAFAEDLQAFLDQQPVAARPPTAWYLLTRFTQRNKLAVASAVIILLLLITGIATSTWLFLKERTALAKSEQVSKFMTEVLAQAGPSKAMGDDATMMRKILDKTADRIGSELRDQPAVAATLRGVMATTYEEIDEYAKALEQAQEMLALSRQLYRGDDERIAQALMARGSSFESLGRMKEAESDLRDALAMRQRLFGDDDPRTAASHAMLAWTLGKSGRAQEGVASAELAMQVWRRHPHLESLQMAPKALAVVYLHTSRREQANEVNREQLAALRARHGEEHPDILICLDNIGYDLTNMKRYDEAEPILLESLRQGQRFFEDRNPVADHALASLSRIAAARQRWDQQLDYARQSYAAAKRVFDPGHRYHREGVTVFSRVLIEQIERFHESDPARAQALLEELTSNPDFTHEMKTANGWIDCIRGALMLRDPAGSGEAKALIQRGLATLQKIAKPTSQQTQWIEKAEAMLLSINPR